jgi:hypothetical protein
MKRTIVLEVTYDSLFNDNDQFVNAIRYRIAEGVFDWTRNYNRKAELLSKLIDIDVVKENYGIQDVNSWLDAGNNIIDNPVGNCWVKKEE